MKVPMTELLKLALQVIAEVLDLVHQAESGVVTPEAAKASLENFKKTIRANDEAVDAAIIDKFDKKED